MVLAAPQSDSEHFRSAPRTRRLALWQAEGRRRTRSRHSLSATGRNAALLDLRRREFILALGGAGAVWPLPARAQQPAVPVIGYLHSASPEPYAAMIAAFR